MPSYTVFVGVQQMSFRAAASAVGHGPRYGLPGIWGTLWLRGRKGHWPFRREADGLCGVRFSEQDREI